MKRLALPLTILAMAILPILTALTSPEKSREQSPAAFQRGVTDPVCTLTEGFDNVGNLMGNGWFMQNNSMPLGGTGWFQGNTAMFTSQSGAPNSYIAADFNNGSGAATISNWLLTPPLLLQNGAVLTFWTRTVTPGAQLFPDRLQVRMSTNGTSTNVGTTATSLGDFTTLLLDINPTYADDYPHVWTQYTVTISGLSSSTTGRLGFRYFVENGGPSGIRSNYIGIDTMAYACPTPTPTPTPTPEPTPTLGNYPATSLPLSTDTTVTPDTAPTNTTSINVSTSTNFKGRLEGYPATGVVRITDAHPAGTYTVTVRAFDSGGASATKAFTLTVTTPATCAPVNFATEYNFAVGRAPTSVAVGDFNGDGKQDLAVTNYNSNPSTLSILLGDGTGNFSNATSFPVGPRPSSVAIGDFNGDGKQDLAVTNYNSGNPSNVSILLGDGTGNFGAATNFAVGSGPFSMAVGDFNNDGKQDLAVANFYSNSVSILLGDGAGHFGAATNIAVGSFPHSIAVGDFNGDGNQDLAAANQVSDNVSILLGDGAGHFSAATSFDAGSHPFSIAVGDFNSDGNQDLAVVTAYSNTVSILLGDGTGNFSAARTFDGGAESDSVAVGDFNGDGNQDLAVSGGDTGILSILFGDGTGNFSAATTFPGDGDAFSIAVGDFNGDGKQDLAVANFGLDNVSILLRVCAVTPTSVVSRMTHGSAGAFDINLALTGSPGIECRTTGRTTNDYTIIATFPNPVTVNGNPQAAVTSGTGCVGTGGLCSGTVSVSGNTVTIPLTNVTNAQTINVTLFRINNGGNVVIPMGVLGGDVNGNGVVNASDIAFAKGHLGQSVDATNFRADLNANGVINAADVSLTKSYLGTGLP